VIVNPHLHLVSQIPELRTLPLGAMRSRPACCLGDIFFFTCDTASYVAISVSLSKRKKVERKIRCNTFLVDSFFLSLDDSLPLTGEVGFRQHWNKKSTNGSTGMGSSYGIGR
jgi:hypothetical protein